MLNVWYSKLAFINSTIQRSLQLIFPFNRTLSPNSISESPSLKWIVFAIQKFPECYIISKTSIMACKWIQKLQVKSCKESLCSLPCTFILESYFLHSNCNIMQIIFFVLTISLVFYLTLEMSLPLEDTKRPKYFWLLVKWHSTLHFYLIIDLVSTIKKENIHKLQ